MTWAGSSAGGRARAGLDGALRRLVLAHACSMVGYWGTTIAVLVYAYEQGGTSLVGVAACVRLLPAALASPYAGMLGDRYPRERVLLVGDLLRMTTLVAAAAAVAVAAPVALVLALIGVNAAIFSSFRPALRALTPTLARTPDELANANVMASAVESIGMLAGPALGGALLAAGGPAAVFAAAAGTLALSAALVAGLHPAAGRRPAAATQAPASLAQLAAGTRAVAQHPTMRRIVLLSAGQTFGYGALSVLIVSVVGDVLQADRGWIGYLNAALGFGGLLGALALGALMLRRLRCGASVGFALWGLPLCVIGLWPSLAVALIALACVGVANTLVDVALNTTLQRVTPPELLARVFSLLGLVTMGSIAAGGLLAPVAVAVVGTRGALLALGLALALLALCAAPLCTRPRSTQFQIARQRVRGHRRPADVSPLLITAQARTLWPPSPPRRRT